MVRFRPRALVPFVLAASLTIAGLGEASAASVTASSAANRTVVPASVAAVALGDICPTADNESTLPNQDLSDAPAVDSMKRVKAKGEERCLGGRMRSTRGRLWKHCVSSNAQIEIYLRYMCGSGPARGIEGIAQARAIAEWNSNGTWGHVSPDVQWEVATGNGTADIVKYDGDADGPWTAKVVEVKQSGSDALLKARTQINRYVGALADLGRIEVTKMDVSGYDDHFKVLRSTIGQAVQGTCADGELVVDQYKVKGLSGDEAGILWVTLESTSCVSIDEIQRLQRQVFADVANLAPSSEKDRWRGGYVGGGRVDIDGFRGSLKDLLQATLDETWSPTARDMLNKLLDVADEASEELGILALSQYGFMVTKSLMEQGLLTRSTVQGVASFTEGVARAYLARFADALKHGAKMLAYAVKEDLPAWMRRVGFSPAVIDSVMAGVARATSFVLRSGGTEAVERAAAVTGERLLARMSFPVLLRIGGRALIVSVPVVGEAALVAWLVWDLIELFKELDKLDDDLENSAIHGEPHIFTMDGRSYDFQAVGEFVMASAPSENFQLQARFIPFGSDRTVSVVGGLALRSNDTVVQLNRDGSVLIDGEPVLVEDLDAVVLDDGSMLMRSGEFVRYSSADARIALTYNGRSVEFFDPEKLLGGGLSGPRDGNWRNDLTTSTGEVLPSNVGTDVLYGRFADSWRVTNESSLFTYAEGESTATFTDKTYPSSVITIADFSAGEIETATAVCNQAGVQPGPVFDDCVFDILVTGDAVYARDAAAITDEVSDPLTATFSAGGELEETFDAPVSTNFAAARYLADPATSRVAGPVFDDTGYSFYVVDVPRHDHTKIEMDLVSFGSVDTDSTVQSVDVLVDGKQTAKAYLEGAAPDVVGAPEGATLTRVATGTTTTGTPTTFARYRLAMRLDHYGRSVKVKLVPRGFRGLLATSLGVDRVKLSLETAVADEYPVAVPFNGTGAIETAGGEDTYTFTVPSASAGRDLYVTSTCSANIVEVLDGPNGSVKPTETVCGWTRFNNLPAGAYQLRMLSEGARPANPSYDISVGYVAPDLSFGPMTTTGTAVTVTLNEPGQIAKGTVNLTAGQRIAIRGDNTKVNGFIRWRLVDPSGQVLATRHGDTFLDPVTASTTGTYSIVVYGYSGAVGPLRLRAWAVPADVDAGTLILDGASRTFSNTVPGQNGSMTFSATEGEKIFLRTTGPLSIGTRMSSPSGKRIASASGSMIVEDIVIPATGQYRLTFDPSSETVGSVTAQVWRAAPDINMGALTHGGAARTFTNTTPGQSGSLTMIGAADDRLAFEVSGASGAATTYRIRRPDGTTLLSGTGNGFHEPISLPESGTYQITFDPTAVSTASLTVRAWKTPADVVSAPLTIDAATATTVATTTPGQNARLTMTGAADTRILLSTANISGGPVDIRVKAPNGDVVFTRSGEFTENVVLPETGDYSVTVDPQGAATVSVDLRAEAVRDVVATVQPAAIVNGAEPTTDVTIPVAGQRGFLEFTATAGQVVYALVDHCDVELSFWKDGERLPGQHPTFPCDDPLVLLEPTRPTPALDYRYAVPMKATAAGTYRLRVDPEGSTVGTFPVHLIAAPADIVKSVAVGANGQVALSKVGQRGVVNITNLQAGQRYIITATKASGGAAKYSNCPGHATMTTPSGAPIGTEDRELCGAGGTYSFFDTFTAPATGAYQVLITPIGRATATWNVVAKAVAADQSVQVATDGTARDVTLTVGQNATATFSGVEGQRFSLGTTLAAAGLTPAMKEGRVSIVKPDGEMLVAPHLVASYETPDDFIDALTLPTTGTYTIRLDPQGAATGIMRLTPNVFVDDGVVYSFDSPTMDIPITTPGKDARVNVDMPAGTSYFVSLTHNFGTSTGAADDCGLYVTIQGAAGYDERQCWDAGGYIDTSTLDTAGRWTIRLDPTRAATGTAKLRINSVPSPASVTATVGGAQVTVANAVPGQNSQVEFSATEGQYIKFTYSDNKNCGATPQLDMPIHKSPILVVCNQGHTYRVPATGTYAITIDPKGADILTSKVKISLGTP